MFTNKNGARNNIIGGAVAKHRKARSLSQRELADKLVAHGIVLDKNAIQRIESGQRFVTETELIKEAKACT